MEIYLNRNGQEVGPYPESEIVGLIQKGVILPTDLVWKEGMAQWEPASKIFAASLASVTSNTAPPPVIGSPHRSVVPIPNSGQSKSIKLVIAGVLSLLLISAIGVVIFAVQSAMTSDEIEPDPYAHLEGESMDEFAGQPEPENPARPLPEPPEPNPTIPLPDQDELVAAPLLSPRADLPVPLAVRLYNRRLTVQPEEASHS